MGAFLHILLCSAAAIGGHYAVGLTAQTHSTPAGDISGLQRFVEPGLMAVPIVRGSTMQGLAFLKLGLTIDAAVDLDDPALNTLIADALYDAVLPEPSKADSANPFDMSFVDLDALRAGIAGRVNDVTGVPVVKDVMVLQLDMRASDDLRSPTLKAVIDG